MYYRNGREAKNGDRIVKLEDGKIVSFGILHGATQVMIIVMATLQ